MTRLTFAMNMVYYYKLADWPRQSILSEAPSMLKCTNLAASLQKDISYGVIPVFASFLIG